MEILMAQKFLMALTSSAKMGADDKATGVWAEELATPYYLLIDQGVNIDFVSPLGGAAPIDPGSVKPSGQNHADVERMLNDKTLQEKLQTTTSADTLNCNGYDGVFFPGGHGTMWDLPTSDGIKQIVEALFANYKIIAAVCHGAAGLVSAKRADGKSILFGKRVNTFTDSEEAAVGLTDVVPFQLESRVRSLGAIFESSANWQPHVTRDGNLITGQNPQSSLLVAQTILAAIGKSAALKAA
jgi:putative intracellular protease/amidase